MRTAMMLLALALVGAPGCKKKPSGTPAAGSGSAMGSGSAGSAMEGPAGSGSAMEGSGSAMEGSAGSAGSAMEGSAGSAAEGSAAEGSAAGATMTHKASKCPSTVYGATTTAAVKGKDVVVTVTAKDKAAVAAIQKRADESVKGKADAKEPSSEHTQNGVHGGTAGICPVYVPSGATAKVKHEKAGVMVTISPKTEKADDLKKDIDDRITKAEAWTKENVQPGDEGGGGGGTGGGGGKGTGGGTGGGK